MTDWEKQLGRRRAAITRAELALEDDIADAHAQGGLSWRKIGAAAAVNHEWARQAAERVAKRRAAGSTDTALPADPVANPGRTRAPEPDAEA
jgi:predicted flavoprotein YhiN